MSILVTTTLRYEHDISYDANNTFNIGSNENVSVVFSCAVILSLWVTLRYQQDPTANGTSVKLVLGFQDETGDGNTAIKTVTCIKLCISKVCIECVLLSLTYNRQKDQHSQVNARFASDITSCYIRK